jgi:hypothetical protein
MQLMKQLEQQAAAKAVAGSDESIGGTRDNLLGN